MIAFTLKAEPPLRLALDALQPGRLAGLSQGEIERLPLQLGNRRECVGDWFKVSGGGAEEVRIAGSGRLDRIGAGMGAGLIRVEGDAGAYLGVEMAGGGIEVAGGAGYGAATALRGGTVRIAGDAGAALGGSLPGEAHGMRGGAVLIGGKADCEAGKRLYRGLIVIGGAAGPGCGMGMIAGTILAGGAVGPLPGVGMRRGSIIALGGAPLPGPGFADCGVHDLLYLKLLARHLATLGVGTLAARLAPLRRWMGDAAAAGKGEILVPP
jgi:formylmethanofuran dehydrogenase subunit C